MAVPSEERDRILRLVAAGQVSAHEAARLLDALAHSAAAPVTAPSLQRRRRLLRIRVTDLQHNRLRVDVTVPLELIEVGWRLATRLAPQIKSRTLEEMLRAVQSGMSGLLLDFHDLEENERVEIFLEER